MAAMNHSLFKVQNMHGVQGNCMAFSHISDHINNLRPLRTREKSLSENQSYKFDNSDNVIQKIVI